MEGLGRGEEGKGRWNPSGETRGASRGGHEGGRRQGKKGSGASRHCGRVGWGWWQTRVLAEHPGGEVEDGAHEGEQGWGCGGWKDKRPKGGCEEGE